MKGFDSPHTPAVPGGTTNAGGPTNPPTPTPPAASTPPVAQGNQPTSQPSANPYASNPYASTPPPEQPTGNPYANRVEAPNPYAESAAQDASPEPAPVPSANAQPVNPYADPVVPELPPEVRLTKLGGKVVTILGFVSLALGALAAVMTVLMVLQGEPGGAVMNQVWVTANRVVMGCLCVIGGMALTTRGKRLEREAMSPTKNPQEG